MFNLDALKLNSRRAAAAFGALAIGAVAFSASAAATPLLDLKPYFASTDAVPEAKVGWHEGRD